MVRAVGFTVLVVALAALAPASALGQKKKPPPPAEKTYPPASAADYAALNQKKQLDGKLIHFDVGAQTMSVRTETPPGSFVSGRKVYELTVRDDVVVRKLHLGVEYDDLGNARVYTPEQKKELRGPDPTRPGYRAQLDDLQPGKDVAVYITPARKDDAKAAGRPAVRMIVILNK